LVVAAAVAVAAAQDQYFRLPQPYAYSCDEEQMCSRVARAEVTAQEYQSLAKCQLTCGRYGAIWPEPTGDSRVSKEVVTFQPQNIVFSRRAAPTQRVEQMMAEAIDVFYRNLHFQHPEYKDTNKRLVLDRQYRADHDDQEQDQEQRMRNNQQQNTNRNSNEELAFDFYREQQQQERRYSQNQPQARFEQQQQQQQQQEIRREEVPQYLKYSPFTKTQRSSPRFARQLVKVEMTVSSDEERMRMDTDESYNLVIQTRGDETTVTVLARTYFGGRHALETLSQMIAFDEDTEQLMMVKDAQVQDKPQFRFRGFMLDTGRNFYPKEDLMKLMDSMSYNKLNRFHWHITDAAAFPLYSVRRPEMAYYGSYAPNKVYYPEDIAEIVEYANLRGIAVVPELSAPGRVSNGWQWGEKEGKGKLVICNEGERWYEFGKEPPSGQINLANPEVMPILADLYTDIIENFEPDMFHMGGDLVSFKCFANSPEIMEYLASQEKEAKSPAFFELWNTFQTNALNQLQVAAGERAVTPIISASMGQRNIPVEQYIVHVQSKPEEVAAFLNAGYKVIVSDQQQWSLDCVTDEWIGEKAVECPVQAPTWETFYNYSPVDQAITNGVTKARADLARDQVLGGEATLESYQTGAKGAERKIWPRVTALAERLWTDPLPEQSEHSVGETMRRINIFRQRMVQLGVQADPIQPEYCLQDQLTCLSQQQQTARSEHPDFTRAEAPAPVQA